jgi:hypothetical protein
MERPTAYSGAKKKAQLQERRARHKQRDEERRRIEKENGTFFFFLLLFASLTRPFTMAFLSLLGQLLSPAGRVLLTGLFYFSFCVHLYLQ